MKELNSENKEKKDDDALFKKFATVAKVHSERKAVTRTDHKSQGKRVSKRGKLHITFTLEKILTQLILLKKRKWEKVN